MGLSVTLPPRRHRSPEQGRDAKVWNGYPNHANRPLSPSILDTVGQSLGEEEGQLRLVDLALGGLDVVVNAVTG